MKSPPLSISIPVNSIIIAHTRRVLSHGSASIRRPWFSLFLVVESVLMVSADHCKKRADERGTKSTEVSSHQRVYGAIAVERRRRHLRFNLFIINNIPATRIYISTRNTGIRHYFEEQSHRSMPLTIEEMWTGRQSRGQNHRYLYALAMNPHIDY